MILEQDAQLLLYRDGPTAHARLVGAVNRETIPVFQGRLEELVPADCTAVTLDLGAAQYLDSDGIRWLQRLQESFSARGTELRLALREGCRAERTLQLVRLLHAFPIDRYPSDTVNPPPLP